MNKMSIDVSGLLYDNVVASDVLKVHKSINNFNIASKEIIDLENNLMINSFSTNKKLFDSKYLYYKLSVILKDISLCVEKKEIEKIFTDLLNKSHNYFMNDFLDVLSKLEQLNELYLINFYEKFIDQPVKAEDVFKVHQGINLNNQTFSEMISLERNMMISSIQKYPSIYANKLAYYKLAMQIKGLGLKIKNLKQAEEIFDKLTSYTSTILDIPNIDSYTKLNILEFLYFKCAQLDFDNNKNFSHQLSIVNKEIKALLKQPLENVEDKKKEKQLVYSMSQKICPV